MGILKVLPLMYLLATTSAWLPENYENCLCPTESPTIINSLDTDRSGVERLVVFVYKKPDTGEIVSFIPQKEHQRKIPDFPNSYGRIHNIDQIQSIREIFDISPSKDIREHNSYYSEPVPQLNSNEYEENTVFIDNKTPEYVNFDQQLDTDINIPEWVQESVKSQDIISFPQPIVGEKDDKKTQILNNNIDMNVLQWPMEIDGIKVNPFGIYPPNEASVVKNIIDGNGIKIPDWQIQLDENKVKREPFITFPNSETEIIPKLPMEFDVNNANSAHIIPKLIPRINDHKTAEIIIDSSEPSTLDVSSQFLPLPSENLLNIPPVDSTFINSFESQEVFPESNPKLTPNGIETLIHIKTPLTEKVHFQDGKGIKFPTFEIMTGPQKDIFGGFIGQPFKFEIDNSKLSNYDYRYIEDPAFELWLREQLRITTINGYRIHSSPSDFIALDRAIRNVLLQNGWVITGQGTLLNSNGITSSLDNLKLRPILVGKPFSYDRFRTQDYSKNPYLEGLLLTMKKPAKILGIVPLSITPVGSSIRNFKNKKGTLKVLPLEHLIAFRKDSKKSDMRKPEDSSKNKSGKPSKGKYKDAALLKEALSEIQEPKHAKGSLTTLKQDRGQVKYYTGYGKTNFKPALPPRPEWRIIGGKVAISSGAALNMKGRSGLI